MSDQTRWGATPEEWAHFSTTLGLTTDLLPVLSKPNVEIAANSKLKALGKVPSRYNAQGKAVGIPHWTKIQATEEQVKVWSANPDYGICIQTRSVRAIDIDVEDEALASQLHSAFDLGMELDELPVRHRPGSSRRLLLVLCDDDILTKHVMRLPNGGGIVELLADGQQFIAAGTHPSGGRYEWHAHRLVPGTVKSHLLELWFGIAKRFNAELIGKDHIETIRTDGTAPAVQGGADPIVDWLQQRGWSRGHGPGGRLYIHCPFRDEHTGDSGETETAYWPRGTGGFERGHFKCLHAHCAGRSDAEYLEAIGAAAQAAGDFEVITAADVEAALQIEVEGAAHAARATQIAGAAGAAGVESSIRSIESVAQWRSHTPGEGLKRTKKGYLATIENVARALNTPGWWRRLGWDAFRCEIVHSAWSAGALEMGGGGIDAWLPFLEVDYSRARIALEQAGFEPVGREMVRDAVRLIAAERTFDSAQLWLRGRQWDGVPRCAQFFETYCSVDVSVAQIEGGAPGWAYPRAVGLYLWSALAGRVLSPGVKADMVPIMVGGQSARKTSAIMALVPRVEWSVKVNLNSRDADLARRLRGVLVAEIAELRGLQSRDKEDVKDFISESHDTWVPKYEEFARANPRRFVFIGTTNSTAFLADETGERRWLPLTVGRIDLPAVERDRDQLWAEGAALFLSGGVAWQDAERLAVLEHDAYKVEDVWEEDLARWLASPRHDANGVLDVGARAAPWGTLPFTMRDVLVFGLGIDTRQGSKGFEVKAARALTILGFVRDRLYDAEGRRQRVWRKMNPVKKP